MFIATLGPCLGSGCRSLEHLYYLVTGAIVGLAVGVTGVGGGSMMTPLLLWLGVPLNTAVGTDLLFAAITKSGAVAIHGVQGSVNWRLVTRIAVGSLPATLLTIAFLKYGFDNPEAYRPLISLALGISLILTSLAILFKRSLAEYATQHMLVTEGHALQWAPLMGAALGVLVTLSSVGAGALGTAMLLVCFPRLNSQQVIGTSLAFSVPLATIAGLGHAVLGNVDATLLLTLLAGSMPAIFVGMRLSRRLPDRWLRPILASTLCAVGIKFVFF